MRRIALVLLPLLLGLSYVSAQNPNCLGLKNPTNFTLTGGTAQSEWSGSIGSKNNQQSNCNSIGATYSSTVTAANLTSQTSSCSSPVSYDINGNNDVSKRFSIKGSGNDPGTNNNLSYLPPDASYTSSIRIGNYCTGAQAEQLIYKFTVNTENQLVTIWYAMSLENAMHSASENPEFVITVEKNTGTASNPNWQLAAGDTLCYIRASPTSGSSIAPFTQNGSNLYLNWNKVIINLEKLLYQQVRIKIAINDCSQSGHYGCCYVAGDCQPMKLSANGCAAGETDDVAGIKAPDGAISYEWYRSLHGKLSGSARTTQSNYAIISGQTSDSLSVVINHFITSDNDTTTETTIMCKMTTKMNETLPIYSSLYADVGNKKPTLAVDSLLACDASINLRDISHTPFVVSDSDNVDTSLTQWKFYSTPQPTPTSLAGTLTGGTVNFQYPTPGFYSVRVRTMTYDTSCWNEKTVTFRTVLAPQPRVRLERNNLCKGDTIGLFDETQGSTFRQWIIHRPEGDTVLTPFTQAIRFRFDTTTRITLRTRNNTSFVADTNGDGLVENVYCYSEFDTTIIVGTFPKLYVTGDTIVCNGDHSNVTVNSDLEHCVYSWYSVLYGTTPVQENSATLSTTIDQDRTFFVKVTSPFGCESWDSVKLYLVNPSLDKDKDKICTGDTVTLWAGKAATYEWTASTYDPTFIGQEGNDTIRVSPTETTTYTVIGHGTNGCGATALSQKITVYPYPIMAVELTPDYIDSENPSVQFSDVSENGASSLWDFGNGNTSTVRTVVFTFSDLSQDSILIHLTTANALGCTNDTSFYIPVGIFAVWFPNAFTPKLETNNIFLPFTANELVDYELYIYDRSGILVFQTNDVANGWDGTFNGNDCKQGAYVYIATYRRPGVERVMSQKGTVMLIR